MKDFQVADDGSVMTPREARGLLAPIMPDKGIIPDRAGTLAQRHAWYEEHKQEILADMEAIGAIETRRKWLIASSSWYGLKGRWLGHKSKAQCLPLPPWNENWPTTVKVAWLNAYGQVYGE